MYYRHFPMINFLAKLQSPGFCKGSLRLKPKNMPTDRNISHSSDTMHGCLWNYMNSMCARGHQNDPECSLQVAFQVGHLFECLAVGICSLNVPANTTRPRSKSRNQIRKTTNSASAILGTGHSWIHSCGVGVLKMRIGIGNNWNIHSPLKSKGTNHKHCINKYTSPKKDQRVSRMVKRCWFFHMFQCSKVCVPSFWGVFDVLLGALYPNLWLLNDVKRTPKKRFVKFQQNRETWTFLDFPSASVLGLPWYPRYGPIDDIPTIYLYPHDISFYPIAIPIDTQVPNCHDSVSNPIIIPFSDIPMVYIYIYIINCPYVPCIVYLPTFQPFMG